MGVADSSIEDPTDAAGSPLSWFQERLWVHHQRNPEDTSWNLPLPLLIRGDLDVAALERSVDLVAARHESLRTSYGETALGESLQFVAPHRHLSLPVVAVDRAALADHVNRFLEHRFDLREGPIFVASLLRTAPREHVLLLNVHHIAADAWSLKAILLAELQGAYAAFCRGEEPSLEPLPVQYRDFAQRQRLADMSADLDYWQSTLDGYEDSMELPTTYPRQVRSGTRSGTFVHRYSADFARNLGRFAREHDATMFMCLLAALGVTLARYADKDDLCIGTTTSNRPDVEFEPLIGFFVNILPMRMRIDEDSTVADLVKGVRGQVLDAFDHPVPFERILQVTDVARRDGGNPLVPVVMRHQNFPEASLGATLPGDVTFESFPEPGETDAALLKVLAREHVPARCEIELSYAGDADGLEVEVVYAADLYDRDAVERLLAHHATVLEGMFADVGGSLVDLPLLRDTDVAQLLSRDVPTVETRDPYRSFLERFDAQAESTPEAVACWDDRGAWTYRDLDARTRQVAHALASRGIAPGDLVAVCLPRSGELLATLLGIWRAGAAYVPIDPAYPAAYSGQILDDANPSVVVADAPRQALIGVDDSVCLLLEDLGDLGDLGDPGDLGDGTVVPTAVARELPADSLAYVMYTSGSTGKPKGVRIPHRQLDNWLNGLDRNYPFADDEVVGQKTTFVFAVGVKELFAGLVNGRPQVIIDDATVRDTAAFADVLAEYKVSRLNILPSHLGGLMEHLRAEGIELPAMRVVVTAGEPLPKDVVLAFREVFPQARLLNNYGCTEVNDITYYDTADFDGAAEFVPIGRPIHHSRVYVLDRLGRLVPDGVAGELHLASVSLPEGYHGLDELTAERFRPNPFGTQPSAVLYNTGDVVRYLPGGDLDFIGRWDFQVKVRGFRVDVRQVEQVMSEVDGVRARAVVGQGEHLAAYYTCRPDRPVPMAELRGFLTDRLPAYMVPDTFVLLDSMPLLPNGKMNRKALIEARGELQLSGGYEAPATATERTLAEIWGVVVNVPASRIGRRTHFFEIGGHSLAAMRVMARIKDSFGVEIGLSELFDSPRLESVARVIDGKLGGRSCELAATSARMGSSRRGGLLHDRVVLVTGGSRGIGLATALLLAEQGATVAINYRDSEGQAARVKEMIEAEGGTADIFGADVTDGEQVAAMVAAVHERFERIDVLVANAHMHFRHRPFLEYDFADLERKVGNELKAIFHPAQAVAPEMIRRRSGSIIAVSSTLSKRSNLGFLAQSTGKAAVDGFVRSLATELGEHGVRVNTVAPGLTLTDAAMPMAPHVKESIAASSPMRRNGLPEDMAGAVVFLASDLSRFMTGTYLPVDGGFTML